MDEGCKNYFLNKLSSFNIENICKTKYSLKDITQKNNLSVYKENKEDKYSIVLDLLNFTHPNDSASKELCSGKDITQLFNEGPHSYEEKIELLRYARGFIKLN